MLADSPSGSDPRGVERIDPPVLPARPIGVVVVADVRLYREGLSATLAVAGALEVHGTASSRDEALELVAETRPDVVVIDVTAREGLEIARALHRGPGAARLVAFAIEDQEQDVLACAEAGIAGYVPHDAGTADLVAAIIEVMRDQFAVSPEIAALLFRSLAGPRPEAPAADRPRLTRRELEIVGLIDGGLSNKEIALQLVIEVATVKNHVHNILDKLQVTSRAAAAASMRGTRRRRSGRPPYPAAV
jgi:two-component system, NarL family, nitrate/nitrite response regulator NarL